MPVPPWPNCFSGILANPPYIPYQALDGDQRQELSRRQWPVTGLVGARVCGLFSWRTRYPFCSGRAMAWVLPGAFLQLIMPSPFGTTSSLRSNAVRPLSCVNAFSLDAGTDEETVILLADNHGSTTSLAPIQLAEATTLPDLVRLIEEWYGGTWACRTDRSPASVACAQ